MAAGYDHVIECAHDLQTASQSEPDFARTTFSARSSPGRRCVWSSSSPTAGRRGARCRRSATRSRRDWPRPSTPAGRTSSACSASTSTSSGSGPTWRSRASRGCSRRCASGCSTSCSPGARNEGRAIPAKGLTGSGYDGHAFWDTETFVLPMLTYALPSAARDALRWRHATLDKAQHRAAQLGLEGAAFPWRTIAGEECSSYWPAGTAAFHVNADIAHAVSKYINATGDDGLHRRLRRRAARARPRACGARSATTTAAATSASTGSPAPTSTARSPTTTCSPTSRRGGTCWTPPRSRAPAGARPPPGRRRGGGRGVARRRQRDDDPLRRGARRAPPVRGLHRPRAVELRRHRPTTLPAVPALPLLRPLPQAGGQAGRPGARPGAVRRPLHRRGEGARLRLLRAADRARLVAVGLHAGGDRGRGRSPRPRLRVHDRGRAHGPRRPRAQLPRRHPHGLAGGRLDRRRGRLRRHAGFRRRADLHATAARSAHAAALPPGLPRPGARGRGDLEAGRLHPALRRAAEDPPPRGGDRGLARRRRSSARSRTCGPASSRASRRIASPSARAEPAEAISVAVDLDRPIRRLLPDRDRTTIGDPAGRARPRRVAPAPTARTSSPTSPSPSMATPRSAGAPGRLAPTPTPRCSSGCARASTR